MGDETVVKTSKNCALGLSPGSLTLTNERLQFRTLIGKKLKMDLPLSDIVNVRPFGVNLVQIDTPGAGFFRIQVNVVTRHDWVETIRQGLSA
jgi:hypothetical protein